MSQGGFSELCGRIGVEEMSFEACYLMYLLVPDVEDVMTVCRSQSALQKTVEGLGCRLVSDCPQKLRSKKAAMVASFDMHSFQPFFRWMFDMGKSISAMNTGAHVGVVRSVPVQVSDMRPRPLQRAREATSQPATAAAASVAQTGLQLMEAVLSGWALMAKFKEFCSTKDLAPFSKDLWTQIGRFAHLVRRLPDPLADRCTHMRARACHAGALGAAAACHPGPSQTTTGQIEPDLSNYDDDGSGGGSAWPCMIDDFVEWVVAQ